MCQGAVMRELGRLERFLRANPRDAGVAAHLLACGPCSEDFTGLVQAVTDG
jgi:hypothetical protein